MEKAVRVEDILSQIKELDYEARLYITNRLIKQLKRTKKKIESPSHNLTELNNLGSEIWKNVNIDKYVEQERQWD